MVPTLPKVAFQVRQRFLVAGVDRQDLPSASHRPVDIALRVERSVDLFEPRKAFAHRKRLDREAHRTQRVVVSTLFSVELDERVGGLSVSAIEERLQTDDGVRCLAGLYVGEAEPLAAGIRPRCVRGDLQVGNPACREPFFLGRLRGEMLEQLERLLVARPGVERRLAVRDGVVGGDLIGHAGQQIGGLVPVVRGGLPLAPLLGPLKQDRGELVEHTEIVGRVAFRP